MTNNKGPVFVASLLLTASVHADDITIPERDAYPSKKIPVRVDESITFRAYVEVAEADAVSLDLVLMIDDSARMYSAINQLNVDWPDFTTQLQQWNSQVGWMRYNKSDFYIVGESPRLANDSTFFTQVLVGYVYQGDTQIPIYEPFFEYDGNGDPSYGIAAISRVLTETPWRLQADYRVLMPLLDSEFKAGPLPSDNETYVSALLAASQAVLLGLETANPRTSAVDPSVFADISGGAIEPMGANVSTLVDDMIAALETLTFPYDSVLLNTDNPSNGSGIDVAVVCVDSGPAGSCDGDAALGDFSRPGAAEFQFDITVDGLSEGEYSFDVQLQVGSVETRTTSVKVTVLPPQTVFIDGFE